MIAIRRARLRDGPRVMAIWRDAVDATHDFLTAADRVSIEQEVATYLPVAPLWLAVGAADRATGFMLLEGARMEALFVDPAAARRGIGRALVDHALTLHAAITTEVNEQNGPARAFYGRVGFTRTGRSERDGQGRPYPLLQLRLAR